MENIARPFVYTPADLEAYQASLPNEPIPNIVRCKCYEMVIQHVARNQNKVQNS